MHYSFSFAPFSTCCPDSVPFRLLLKLLAISCSVTVASSSSESSVAFLFVSRFFFALSIFFASFCGSSVASVSGTSFLLSLQVHTLSSDRFLTSMSGFLRLHEILPMAAVGGGSPSMMTTLHATRFDVSSASVRFVRLPKPPLLSILGVAMQHAPSHAIFVGTKDYFSAIFRRFCRFFCCRFFFRLGFFLLLRSLHELHVVGQPPSRSSRPFSSAQGRNHSSSTTARPFHAPSCPSASKRSAHFPP